MSPDPVGGAIKTENFRVHACTKQFGDWGARAIYRSCRLKHGRGGALWKAVAGLGQSAAVASEELMVHIACCLVS